MERFNGLTCCMVLFALSFAAPFAQAATKGCSMQVLIDAEQETASAGADATFVATVSGGQPPFRYRWDLNDDQLDDAPGESVTTRFATAGDQVVAVSVTDDAQCTATDSQVQVVNAPRLSLISVGDPEELCGDGDSNVEPGERFAIPMTLENNGSAAATDAYAILTPASGPSAEKLTLGPDRFGYTLADEQEPTCRLDFTDISSTGAAISIDPDDASALIGLEANGIVLYGEQYDQIVVSDNGYISTDLDDDGSDFFVTCPLPSPPQFATPAARVYAFWDDLKLFDASSGQGSLHYEYFEQCPRTADRGLTTGCHIIQWTNASYGTGGPRGLGLREGASLNIQAVFYDATGDIVLQRNGEDPVSGRDSAIGLIDSTGEDGLGYRCGLTKSDANAVCIASPVGNVAAPLSAQSMTLETPAITLGNLNPGQATTREMVIGVAEEATCGNRVGLDFEGAVSEESYSDTGAGLVLDVTLGGSSAVCDNQVSCPLDDSLAVLPENGMLLNPNRPGNGVDVQYVGENVAMLWFTATSAHEPTWLFHADRFRHNQVIAQMKQFSFGGTFAAGDPSSEVVGQSTMTWIDRDRAIFHWERDGQRSAELMQLFSTDPAPTDEVLTAQWFNPDESGWGLAINRQGDTEIQAAYIYDDQGAATWLLSGRTNDEGISELRGFQWAHCPGCPWVAAQPEVAGQSERTLDPDGGSVSIDVTLPAPRQGSWQRTDMPIQKIQ